MRRIKRITPTLAILGLIAGSAGLACKGRGPAGAAVRSADGAAYGAEPSGPYDAGAATGSVDVANKALITNFFAKFNASDFDGAFALVADDVKWWVPGTLPISGMKDKAGYRKIVAGIRAGFPNGFRSDVGEMIAADGKVAVEVESHGCHANGHTYHNTYHFLFRIENGMIVAVKEYMDTLHLAMLLQADPRIPTCTQPGAAAPAN